MKGRDFKVLLVSGAIVRQSAVILNLREQLNWLVRLYGGSG